MDDKRDLGLLVLRAGLGGMFVFHGLPKLIAGPERWESLGHATRAIGIDFAPTVFGLAAAVSETFGGLCVALGVLFRPSLALLFTTMVVASAQHLQRGDGFGRASHAIEAAIVFAALWLIGSGRHVARLGKLR